MNQQRQLDLYAKLMDEVKIRIDVINRATSGHLRLPNPFVREFCFLQLRMLCELLALSCLVAHGDIAFLQSHKLGKSYSADDILDRLSKLRAHFYPKPVIQKIVNPGPPRRFEHEAIEPSPLPKEALLKLYGQTHKHLHRGSLKKLLSSESTIDGELDVQDLVSKAQSINDLLNHHLIWITESQVIMCMLQNKDNNMAVQVAVAEAPSIPGIR